MHRIANADLEGGDMSLIEAGCSNMR